MKPGIITQNDVRLPRVDGSLVDGNVRIKIMDASDRDHFDVIVAVSDISERKRAEKDRERLIEQLELALAEVKKLSGFLPICASCKKIRDDQGYWQQIEAYISEHSEAEFSHGICPECAKKAYEDLERLKHKVASSSRSSESREKKTALL